MPLVLNKKDVMGVSLTLIFFTVPRLVSSLVKNMKGNSPGNTATIKSFSPLDMLALYLLGLLKIIIINAITATESILHIKFSLLIIKNSGRFFLILSLAVIILQFMIKL